MLDDTFVLVRFLTEQPPASVDSAVREVHLESRTPEGMLKYVTEEQWKQTKPVWWFTGPYSPFGYVMGNLGWAVKKFANVARWFEARPWVFDSKEI